MSHWRNYQGVVDAPGFGFLLDAESPEGDPLVGAELPGVDVRAAAAAPIPGVAIDGECAGAIELLNPVVDDFALDDLVAACAMLPELLMLGAS